MIFPQDLIIPLDEGTRALIPSTMSQESFAMLIATLHLWRPRLVPGTFPSIAELPAPDDLHRHFGTVEPQPVHPVDNEPAPEPTPPPAEKEKPKEDIAPPPAG